MSVLLVDDNQHVRFLLRHLLSGLGVQDIEEASDGGEAFRMLDLFPADLVICDWMMEPIDGLTFIRRMRTSPASANPFVPIIMISAHAEESRVLQARDAGATEFIAKPLSANLVYRRIVNIIERPRPFVRTSSYFGPCRRRTPGAGYMGPERRGGYRDSLNTSIGMLTV